MGFFLVCLFHTSLILSLLYFASAFQTNPHCHLNFAFFSTLMCVQDSEFLL